MDDAGRQFDVVIVGGDPVGLLLATRLALGGCEVAVLDRRPVLTEDDGDVVALQPAARAVLDATGVGLDGVLVDAGPEIPRAQFLLERKPLAALEFARLEPAYPGVLVLPRSAVTAALRERALAAGVTLAAGWEATYLESPRTPVTLRAMGPDGLATWRARFLVGCDGADSWLRQELGVPAPGWGLRHTYWYGDFPALTAEDLDAQIYLGSEGLAASVPLPDGRRRWLVRQHGRPLPPDSAALCRLVRSRTAVALPPPLGPVQVCKPDVACGVTARAFHCALVGSAAHHIRSPGVQATSLGLLNATELTDAILATFAEPVATSRLLDDWDRRAHHRYDAARRRAETLMTLGQPGAHSPWRARLLALALHTPLANHLTIH